ncbi:MAG: DoxX family membrane protein [Acidimicrobiales bacterium]
MPISRVLARPMLSSIFVFGGIDAARHPDSKVKAADAVVQPLVARLPALPQDTETLVKLNAAVQIGAGALLAVGRLRRLAALALVGSIVPTTFAGHRFWQEADEASRSQQLIHFLKNLGLLGGLILAAVDTEGSPSLGWRVRRQARRAGLAAGATRAEAKGMVGDAKDKISQAEGRAVGKVTDIADKAGAIAKSGADLADTQLSASRGQANKLLAKAHDRLPVG